MPAPLAVKLPPTMPMPPAVPLPIEPRSLPSELPVQNESPTASLLPPLPPALVGLGTQPGYGSGNPSGGTLGCPELLPVGPKNYVWLNYTTLLLWLQPTRSPFNLANGNLPNQTARVLLDGQRELGLFVTPRLAGGMWLNDDHTFGLQMDGFISEDRSQFDTVTGNGRTIARPFIDAVTGQRTELLVANNDPSRGPVNLVGSIAQTVTARFVGAGIHVRRNQVYDETYQFDVFYGFRYYDLSESLTVYQNTTVAQNNIITVANQPVAAGSNLLIQDRAFTRNQFYGGEVGSYLEYKFGRGFFSLMPKLAFGSIHQVTQFHGETSTTGTTVIEPVAGGLLAAGRGPSNGNLGRFITNRFGVATDINMQVGLTISDGVRLSVGYQFYYLNNVARPGNQFDQSINTRVVPTSSAFGSVSGPRAPNVTFDREGFYAHGASISFEATY